MGLILGWGSVQGVQSTVNGFYKIIAIYISLAAVNGFLKLTKDTCTSKFPPVCVQDLTLSTAQACQRGIGKFLATREQRINKSLGLLWRMLTARVD